MITQPTIKPSNTTATVNKSTAKTAAVQVSTEDTVVTLSKSGKTLEVPKSITKKQLKMLDNYLSKHINLPFQTVSPNALPCGEYISTYYEDTDKFKPADGKYIGIWTNYLTYYQCLHYGFNQYFVYNLGGIQTAIDSGFIAGNIMADLGGDYTAAYNYLNGSPSNIGYYYIDEPYERGTYSTTQIANLSSILSAHYPNSRLFFTNYTIPDQYLDPNNIVYCEDLITNSNVFIQCDQFYGNCFGHTYEYWDAFKNYYQSKNISNWLHVVINNGNETDPTCGYRSTSWQTLMSTADGLGIDNIWLYAYDTGDQNAVIDFTLAAWQSGWMYKYQDQITTVWQCTESNPCVNCVWPNVGTWNV